MKERKLFSCQCFCCSLHSRLLNRCLKIALRQRQCICARAFHCIHRVFQPGVIVSSFYGCCHVLKIIVQIQAEFQISHQNNLWTHHEQFTLFNEANRMVSREQRLSIYPSEVLRVYSIYAVETCTQVHINSNVCKSLEWNCLTMCCIWFWQCDTVSHAKLDATKIPTAIWNRV